MLCCAVQCSAVLHCAVLCYVVLCCAVVLCSAVQCSAVQYCAVPCLLCYATFCCIALQYANLHAYLQTFLAVQQSIKTVTWYSFERFVCGRENSDVRDA